MDAARNGVSRRSFIGGAALAAAGAAVIAGSAAAEEPAQPGAQGAAEGAPASAQQPGAAEGGKGGGNAGGAKEPSVTAISRVFGNGQIVIAAVLNYGVEIDPDSLSPEAFTVIHPDFLVDGAAEVTPTTRTITSVVTNSENAITDTSVPGQYVVINLKYYDPLVGIAYRNDCPPQNYTRFDNLEVTQLEQIRAADGSVIAPGGPYKTAADDNGITGNAAKKVLVMDDFSSDHTWTDPEWKANLRYNIFYPDGYAWNTIGQATEKYPLVVFSPDAGASESKNWETSLYQGNGAIVFAEPEWQAEHPCIVVDMFYTEKFINDYWEYHADMTYGTLNLVKHLIETLPVDPSRVYALGQSMGAMNSLLMNMADHDVFACTVAAACQWDTEEMMQLADDNMVFISAGTAEGSKQKQWIDAACAAYEELGIEVPTAKFDCFDYKESYVEDIIRECLDTPSTKHYLRYNANTLGTDAEGNSLGASSHSGTWAVAYDLPYLKEWLFTQTKDQK